MCFQAFLLNSACLCSLICAPFHGKAQIQELCQVHRTALEKRQRFKLSVMVLLFSLLLPGIQPPVGKAHWVDLFSSC